MATVRVCEQHSTMLHTAARPAAVSRAAHEPCNRQFSHMARVTTNKVGETTESFESPARDAETALCKHASLLDSLLIVCVCSICIVLFIGSAVGALLLSPACPVCLTVHCVF